MNCLHICNDFMGSKVHENLYRELEKQGIDQTIFYALRKTKISKVKDYEKKSEFKLIYSRPLRRYHPFLFRSKIRFLYKDLKANTNLDQFDIVHATTLFSDGALALKLHKRFDIPYIVAVRGSDVNVFFNYRKDLYLLAKEILLKATKIIFISKSLEQNFFKNKFMNYLRSSIEHKCLVINNGIDNIWLKNPTPKKKVSPYRLLYIGNFDDNKNIVRLIEAISILKSKYPKLTLDLVGGGGRGYENVLAAKDLHKDIINYHGTIYQKDKLKQIYSHAHIFAMASISETFGLVYLEALTQGLPIICSENQGIDGTFKKKVGEFVNPKSVPSIIEAIEKIINNYDDYVVDKVDFSQFYWQSIGAHYSRIYQYAIAEK